MEALATRHRSDAPVIVDGARLAGAARFAVRKLQNIFSGA